MSTVLAAARQGDRHTHLGSVIDSGGALLSVAVGALVAVVGSGGVTTVAMGAGVGSGGGGGQITLRDVIPLAITGVIAVGSPRTFLGPASLAAALAGDAPLDCHQHSDGPIRTGSAAVFAEGRRLARQMDETSCGAMICDGELTVLVGGAPVDGAPPDPMAVATQGAALASVAVGTAIAAGAAAVATARQWGEALLGDATTAVETTVASLGESAGTIGAQAGALLGGVISAVDSLRVPPLGGAAAG